MNGLEELRDKFARFAEKYKTGNTVFLIDASDGIRQVLTDHETGPTVHHTVLKFADFGRKNISPRMHAVFFGDHKAYTMDFGLTDMVRDRNFFLSKGQSLLEPGITGVREGFKNAPLHLVLVSDGEFTDIHAQSLKDEMAKLKQAIPGGVMLDVIFLRDPNSELVHIVESITNDGGGEPAKLYDAFDTAALEVALVQSLKARMEPEARAALLKEEGTLQAIKKLGQGTGRHIVAPEKASFSKKIL